MIPALLGGVRFGELFGGAMFLVGGIVFVVSVRYVWRATAVVRATEMIRFDHHDPGSLVRITGRAALETDDPLVAPFSGADTVALRYSIEERRLSALSLFPWYATIHESAGTIDFDVRTSERSIPVIEPDGITLANRVVATVHPDDESPDRIARFEGEIDGALPRRCGAIPQPVLCQCFEHSRSGRDDTVSSERNSAKK